MDSDQSTSSTDEDVVPLQSDRMTRGGRSSGNGRAGSGALSVQNVVSMEQQIHKLEVDAYLGVLRAFAAQSEHISWAKEGVISDLRKELRIPDGKHRELVAMISSDETVENIRDLRKNSQHRPLLPYQEPISSPTVSNSHPKRRKMGGHADLLLPPQIPPSAANHVVPLQKGVLGKKSRSKGASVNPAAISQRVAAAGGVAGRGYRGRGPVPGKGGGGSADIDKHVGRHLQIRWPEDGTFYDAVVTDYDLETRFHALAYDIDKPTESWEWVDLLGMEKKDVKWKDSTPLVTEGSVPPAAKVPSAGRGSGRGVKRGGRGGLSSGVGRAKGGQRGRPANSHAKGGPPRQSRPRNWRGNSRAELLTNGTEKKVARSVEIHIPDIAAFVKQSDNLEQEDDLEKLEAAKRTAKVHEENLRKALADVGESSDDVGSGDGRHWARSPLNLSDKEQHPGEINLGNNYEDYTMRVGRPEGLETKLGGEYTSVTEGENEDDDDI